jgi:hypothetical protein
MQILGLNITRPPLGVAQTFSLLYRRFSIGRDHPRYPAHSLTPAPYVLRFTFYAS